MEDNKTAWLLSVPTCLAFPSCPSSLSNFLPLTFLPFLPLLASPSRSQPSACPPPPFYKAALPACCPCPIPSPLPPSPAFPHPAPVLPASPSCSQPSTCPPPPSCEAALPGCWRSSSSSGAPSRSPSSASQSSPGQPAALQSGPLHRPTRRQKLSPQRVGAAHRQGKQGNKIVST